VLPTRQRKGFEPTVVATVAPAPAAGVMTSIVNAGYCKGQLQERLSCDNANQGMSPQCSALYNTQGVARMKLNLVLAGHGDTHL
jgi:hypothetical protein